MKADYVLTRDEYDELKKAESELAELREETTPTVMGERILRLQTKQENVVRKLRAELLDLRERYALVNAEYEEMMGQRDQLQMLIQEWIDGPLSTMIEVGKERCPGRGARSTLRLPQG